MIKEAPPPLLKKKKNEIRKTLFFFFISWVFTFFNLKLEKLVEIVGINLWKISWKTEGSHVKVGSEGQSQN